MEYLILGPVEVRDGDTAAPLDGAKPRTVLAALLLAGGRLLSDSELSALLWGARPPATMNAQIYNHVSRLRKTVGPAVSIVRRSPGYQMRIGDARFDLREFERLAASGQTALRAGRYAEAGELIRQALALWRGPALADVSEHLAAAEGPRLEEARIAALESLVEADLALGRHAQVLPELTRLVARHPLRERFQAQLMTTLYRCDRQAEALAVFERSRRMLAEELGIEPGRLLREVQRAVLTGDPALLMTA
ncbi:AfsR/SARP family transcriptional regulator [Actinomadura sp. NAK00032]|uniref:AfsR/SARP family transcriptional regulator n=1 Tax=Actinomadura sp. NAK00032 TaxID=2742128 RepID=UPI001590E297|nr:AfsR/SARP family transcriptional regulator [Actinomadura sp. NAK00032]QKW35622.1 AfsR/SARP family transcriptional regulator [Actinomadura sp. NAK00032]